MHEFVHALGVFHMHSRPDRDQYVEIKWNNIQAGLKRQFWKCKYCLTYDTEYDAKSFMHYKSHYMS